MNRDPSRQHYSGFCMVIAGAIFCSKAAEFKSVLSQISLQILSISCQKLSTTNKQNKQEFLESWPGVLNASLKSLLWPAELHWDEEVWYYCKWLSAMFEFLFCLRIVQFLACDDTARVVPGESNPEMFWLLCLLTAWGKIVKPSGVFSFLFSCFKSFWIDYFGLSNNGSHNLPEAEQQC